MADFDGFLVSLPAPSFSDALSSDAPIVDGDFKGLKAFSSSAATFFLPDEGAGGPTYRMRAIDTGLMRTVFWSSSSVDSAGVDYPGDANDLNDIVVQNIIGAEQ